MFRTQFRIMKTLVSLMALGLMDGTGAPGTGSTGTGEGGNGGSGSGGSGSTGGTGSDWDGPYDAERAKRALLASRSSENEAKETARKEKERADAAEARSAAILKAAGLNPDGTPDPAAELTKAQKERDEATAKAKAQAIELAVFKAASDPKVNANAAKLLDSRSFMSVVDKLNPDRSDFADKVGEAIKDAVKADASFAAGPVAPQKQTPPPASTASGAFNGGGGNAPAEPRSAHERLMRAYAANSQTT